MSYLARQHRVPLSFYHMPPSCVSTYCHHETLPPFLYFAVPFSFCHHSLPSITGIQSSPRNSDILCVPGDCLPLPRTILCTQLCFGVFGHTVLRTNPKTIVTTPTSLPPCASTVSFCPRCNLRRICCPSSPLPSAVPCASHVISHLIIISPRPEMTVSVPRCTTPVTLLPDLLM